MNTETRIDPLTNPKANFHCPIEEEDEVNHQSEAEHPISAQEESFEEIQVETQKVHL